MVVATLDIVSAADEYVAAWRRHREDEKIMADLKPIFRETAAGRTMEFPTSDAGAAVIVEQKPDAVCKVVEAQDIPKVVQLSGEHLLDLYSLHPSRENRATGQRFATWEQHALTLRPKRDALSLAGLLRRACTPLVKVLLR